MGRVWSLGLRAGRLCIVLPLTSQSSDMCERHHRRNRLDFALILMCMQCSYMHMEIVRDMYVPLSRVELAIPSSHQISQIMQPQAFVKVRIASVPESLRRAKLDRILWLSVLVRLTKSRLATV